MRLEIDEQRAISLASAPGPIIDPKYPDGRSFCLTPDFYSSQDGVRTALDTEPLRESLARVAAQHIADQAQRFRKSPRLPPVIECDAGNSLRENLPFTVPIAATKSACPHSNFNCGSMPG